MKIFRIVLVAVAILSLSACFKIYRLDVQQGNVVTEEMIDKLKPGMSQKAVKSILGTPLVTDPFHKDRWDYYYSYRNGSEKTEQHHHITIVFENKQFLRIEGDLNKVVKRSVNDIPIELQIADETPNVVERTWNKISGKEEVKDTSK